MARITIDSVHAIYPPAKRVTKRQFEVLEHEFGAELPRGFRAFLERFGHGWINNWLSIYCPDADSLTEQRESLARDFAQYTRDFGSSFESAKLSEEDMRTCVQIGINQDVMRLFACRRFPGCVFEWSGLTITKHKAGVEVLDPFAALRMDLFAYFFPTEPAPEFRSLACQTKTLEVGEVVRAIEERCKGPVHVIDVDEGPGLGTRTPAFWLFPEQPGAKLHVYGVETTKARRVYLTLGTSPTLLPKVNSLIDEASSRLGVKFKPAAWY